MNLTTDRPRNKRPDEVPDPRATDCRRYTVDDHELPNWHSTISVNANADVATHAGELTITNARPPVWDVPTRGQVAARPLLTEQGR